MNYFKKDGQVYAYDDEQVAAGYGKGMAKLSKAEADALENPPELLQIQSNNEARAYLALTDWYVIRMQETGEPIPRDILAERAKRRAEVIE
jgi:hypothetical protein